ncbi:MAG: peptide ABC transporter permease [Legionellales bacterium]|nr:peptide ABC transporter permease [Legionellales bacterium]|tara:strand:+ start:688 stop:1662 length:975 start_codon:yes stop_codon:yes gene_type:complete
MLRYVLKRLLFIIPILVGVNLFTFVLFFIVNTPDDIARLHLGEKYVTEEAIEDWKEVRGYHYPVLYNQEATGLSKVTDTIFFQKSLKLFAFEFGISDAGTDISHQINQRYLPSLAIAVPALLVGLFVNISFALLLVLFHRSLFDRSMTLMALFLMSISALFYIIGGQYLVANIWRLVPISGYEDGLSGIKFLILPVIVGVIGGIGSGVRWYRTIFLEEITQDYVRTAKAKGLSDIEILFKHVLRNGFIPILTGVVVILPLLFMGSLITESFFGIPGLGSYTIDAISQQDFAIVRSMVFLGAFLYCIGLILTDISYTLVDPRVRF